MITLLFTCDECGLEDEKVIVRARESSEDIIKYMELTITPAVQHVHQKLSRKKNGFSCRAKKITFLKIPFDNEPGSWIGKQTDKIPPKGRQ